MPVCAPKTAVDHIFARVFRPKPECKLLLDSYEFTNILTGVQMPPFSELSKALVFDITPYSLLPGSARCLPEEPTEVVRFRK